MSSRRLIRIGDCGRGGREGRLLTGYLLGALPTSITCGLLLVFAPPGSGTSIMAKHGVNPVLNIVVGALILFGKGSARDTFIVGILLSFPGGTYIAEMNLLSKQNTGTAVSGRGANILV